MAMLDITVLLKRPAQDVTLAYCWAHARRKLHDVRRELRLESPNRAASIQAFHSAITGITRRSAIDKLSV